MSNTKFCPKPTLLNFWAKLTQKEYFQSKKNENHHRILHIPINPGSKVQLQQTILIYGTGILLVENKKKMNITIEFLIFRLV